MIASNLKESEEKRLEIIDCPFEVVKSAVDFLYEKDIKSSITDANGAEFLQFADKYDIRHFQVSFYSICSNTNKTMIFRQ